MTLGDIIKQYRTSQHLSMDAFSEKSGISKAYISLLEKNKHPKTGKTIAPSIQCIKQAADGMGMDFNTLFSMIDGNISLEENASPSPELTARDERDIKKDLDNIMDKIRSGEDGPLYYGDTEIDSASLSLLQNAFEYALRETKKENKVKYNPNKNKK
ncbi:helix-turn-helix domain-containing protein [Clostridium fessum]|uniref:helix-turn-helix domain-containing protein n=1 Tax=Clostridium fessum TaxID=2126740 RepID=UPI00399BCC78